MVDVDDRSFGQALRDQYGALSWDAIVQRRLANLDPLIGLWPGPTVADLIGIFGYGSWNPVGTRWNDFFRLLPSLHAFSFALVCAVLLLPFLKADQRPQRDAALRMLVALVATLAVFVLLMFEAGGTVNHQGTYAVQVLATMCAFTVLTLRARAARIRVHRRAGRDGLGDLCVHPEARPGTLAVARDVHRHDARHRGLLAEPQPAAAAVTHAAPGRKRHRRARAASEPRLKSLNRSRRGRRSNW